MADLWQEFRDEGTPEELVDELQEAYVELKENFYAGKHRPQEVAGGRFAEAALRILQSQTGGLDNGDSYTPLGDRLPNFYDEVERLRRRPSRYHDSLRVRIPRILLSIYDVRNGRDAAHLTDEVDPNLADATLVVTNADWVLAELVRLFHEVDLDEAQARVDGLVRRKVPAIEMFGDVPKVLRPGLKNPAKMLLILYHFDERGASTEELAAWLKIKRTYNARATLRKLDDRAEIHFDADEDRSYITRRGIRKVEEDIGLTAGSAAS